MAPTPDASRMCRRSPSRPSLRSSAAEATPRSAMPSAMRGVGCSSRCRACASNSAGKAMLPRSASSASRASPSVPLTYTSSPARAPERSSAWLLPSTTGTSPNTVMQMFSGPRVVSPPTSSQPWASASASRPRENASSQASSTRGSASASVKASGVAPQAARSLRLTASALWPRVNGSTSAKKCRPSTSMSLEIASCMPGAGWSSAQSSPTPSTARAAGRVK